MHYTRIHQALLVFSFLLILPHAFAQSTLNEEQRKQVEKYLEKKNQQNFAGWKGIAFFCNTGDHPTKAVRDICDGSYVNAEFLAASAKVKMTKIKTATELGFFTSIGDELVLAVDIESTSSGWPVAIYANVRAYSSYGSVRDDFNRPKSPRMTPRSGDLVMWERSVIGASSGSDSDLVEPISQNLDRLLKMFFTTYLGAQK